MANPVAPLKWTRVEVTGSEADADADARWQSSAYWFVLQKGEDFFLLSPADDHVPNSYFARRSSLADVFSQAQRVQNVMDSDRLDPTSITNSLKANRYCLVTPPGAAGVYVDVLEGFNIALKYIEDNFTDEEANKSSNAVRSECRSMLATATARLGDDFWSGVRTIAQRVLNLLGDTTSEDPTSVAPPHTFPCPTDPYPGYSSADYRRFYVRPPKPSTLLRSPHFQRFSPLPASPTVASNFSAIADWAISNKDRFEYEVRPATPSTILRSPGFRRFPTTPTW